MKRIIFSIYLLICVGPAFGQSTLSKEVNLYLKNEIRYKKQAYEVVKHNLKENNKSLMVKDLDFIIVPTFKAKERYLSSDLDSFLLTLEMDKGILLEQILMFEQDICLSGFTFCESNDCNVYLYGDSPEWFRKVEKAAKMFIIGDKYELIFKVENYPQLWFLWKENQLSVYSFLNETLYKKNELQLFFENYIKKKTKQVGM